MPFVKKTDPKGIQTTRESQKIFVGRLNELHFFQDSILAPADPMYNIVSIYGDGGVGKSTLVNRLLEETQAPEFKDYCLVAIVDERQATPANMMEKFADQLHMADFKRALSRYKDMLRKRLEEQETMQDAILQRAPDFAGAAVEGVPIVGPLLREGLKLTTSRVLHEYHVGQSHKDIEHIDDLVADLTQNFVAGLNQLADAFVPVEAGWARRRRHILLFFDTFEQLAAEAAPWLLDYFLAAEISSNVVLVTSGRYPIERSIPDDPKRWMPYRDNNVIYSISLNSFNEEETRSYLEQRGITDPVQVESIWRLSRGLPLYLSLLTWNAERVIDPTADVVANFLRWIPEHEEVKRRLVLDASLFSRPFNQDDLSAFSYCDEKGQLALFHWLISQPFVRKHAANGRHSYHELAEDLFSRHLYQRSPQAWHTTRRALADYYRRALTQLHNALGNDDYGTAEWLNLILALAQQLFLLPDAASHSAAIESCLDAHERTKQDEEISRILRDLVEDQPYNMANADARQAAQILLDYLDAEPTSLSLLNALNKLLSRVDDVSTFSRILLAQLYSNRGIVYRALDDNLHSLDDFNRALELNPNDALIYGNRGITYRALKRYELALHDFDQSLHLDATLDWIYTSRGETYRHLNDYRRAIADFDRAIALDPEYAMAYVGRGRAHRLLKEYERSISDLQRAVTLDPELPLAYAQLGEAYRAHKEYERAIESYNRAIELAPAPGYFWAYGSRGYTYFLLKQYHHAIEDYTKAIALNPTYTWGYGERGRTYRHIQQYEQAVADLTQAISLNETNSWAYSHRGLAYADMQQYERALSDFDRAIALHPNYGRSYGRRANIYLQQGDLEHAGADFARNSELDPADIRARWMYTWITLCQSPQVEKSMEQLASIAARQPEHYIACVCRAVYAWLTSKRDVALQELDNALALQPGMWDAYFWHGYLLQSVDQRRAEEELERAIQMGMPAVLQNIRAAPTQ